MDSIIKSWLERDYELIALGSVNWHAKSGKKEVKNHFKPTEPFIMIKNRS